MMPPPLAILIGAGLAISEAVQLEIIKVAGIAISSLAATGAAWLTWRDRVELRAFREEQRRRRAEVRNPANEQLVVVDHPPDPPAGAHRRHTDPPPEEVP